MSSYSDDFNRASLGANWTAVNGGTWAINASTTLQQTQTDFIYRGLRWAGGAFASNNFYARVTAQTGTNQGMGILIRCPTTGTAEADIDGYAIVGFADDQWYRIEFTNGSDVGYVGLGGTCAANTNYLIEVRADGSTITVYLAGSQLAQWTDTTYTTGGAMLVTFGGTVTFDNFEAADLATNVTVSVGVDVVGVADPAASVATASNVTIAAAVDVIGVADPAATVSTADNVTVTPAVDVIGVADPAASVATASNVTVAAAVDIIGVADPAATVSTADNVTVTPAMDVIEVADPAASVVAGAGIVVAVGAGYALRFYGNASGQIDRGRIELDTPANPPVDVGAGDFTYEFWMRCTYANNASTATDEDARYSNIILDRDIYGHQRGWVLGVTRSGADLVVCFGVAGSGLTWSTIFGTADIGDDSWHHVALVRRQSTGGVQVYVDGVLDASGTYTTGDLSYPDGERPSSGQDNPYLVVGTEKHDVGYGYNGYFDELRVSDSRRYTTTFTPSSRLAVDADTVALFHLNEGSGTTGYDSSGLSGAETMALLVGGSPSGPVWAASDLNGWPAVVVVDPAASVATTSNVTVVAAVDVIGVADPAATVVTVSNVTVTPAADVIGVADPAITVATAINVTVTPAADVIGVADPTATVVTAVNVAVTPTVDVIAVADPAATISTTSNVTVSAPVDVISVVDPAAAAVTGGSVNVAVALDVIGVTDPAASVATTSNVMVAPAVDVISVAGPAPTVVTAVNVTVTPAVDVIGIADPAASIDTAGSVTIAPAVDVIGVAGPAITVATTSNVTVAVAVDVVGVADPAAAVATGGSAVVAVAADVVGVADPAATVVTEKTALVLVGADAVSVVDPDATVVTTSNVTVTPAVDVIGVADPAITVLAGIIHVTVAAASDVIGIWQPSAAAIVVMVVTLTASRGFGLTAGRTFGLTANRDD